MDMIGKTVSHYRILKKLGGGGMGVVYRAEDTRLKRTVALKFLPPELTRDPEAKERLTREAQAASALQDPSICVVHDIDETPDGQLYIVMEYVDGETLTKKIERGPLELDEAIDIAVQVAQGLARAHAHGIVHRDIKPANVMISTEGTAKIVDFGLAKLSGVSMLTKAGTTLGTAAYMSPEQARGEPADHRTDIWSLGVVLYEMFAGERPFRAEYENALIYSILNTSPEPLHSKLRGIPPELERIVQRALSKSPADRYQGADEMIEALRGLAAGPRTGMRGRGTPTGVREKFPRRARRAILFGVPIAVALVAAGVWLFKPGLEGPGPDHTVASLAVLPLSTVVHTDDDRMFADGIHGEILTRLTKINRLEVKAKPSVMQYRETNKRVSEIGRDLGVEYLVEGGIQKASGRIRIQVQLIDTRTENQVWAETYDQEYAASAIFKIQSEIAQKVAAALSTTLTPAEQSSIDRRPTENLEAYEYYLKGNYYWDIGLTTEENQKAADMYAKAVALDPGFALAYAKLAQVECALMVYENVRSPARIAAARGALERVLALAPDLPYAHVAEADYARYVEADSARAVQEARAAVREEPNNGVFLHELGDILLVQGEMQEANDVLLRAFHLNPIPIHTYWVIGSYMYLRRFKEAEQWCDIAISMAPTEYLSHSWKWFVVATGEGDLEKGNRVLEAARQSLNQTMRDEQYCNELWSRNYETASRILERDTAITGLVEYPFVMNPGVRKALLLLLLGHRERATALAHEVIARVSKDLEKRPEFEPYHLALGLAYAILGRRDAALREAGIAAHPGMTLCPNWGKQMQHGAAVVHILTGDYDQAIDEVEILLSTPSEVTQARLRLDPIYDPLRGNPRFQALLTRDERIPAE